MSTLKPEATTGPPSDDSASQTACFCLTWFVELPAAEEHCCSLSHAAGCSPPIIWQQMQQRVGSPHTAPVALQIIIMKRNSLVYISRLVQTAGIALIVATLLIRPTMSQNSVTDGLLVSALSLLLLHICCLCLWQGCTSASAALLPSHNLGRAVLVLLLS